MHASRAVLAGVLSAQHDDLVRTIDSANFVVVRETAMDATIHDQIKRMIAQLINVNWRRFGGNGEDARI
jgi:hypothetical protein